MFSVSRAALSRVRLAALLRGEGGLEALQLGALGGLVRPRRLEQRLPAVLSYRLPSGNRCFLTTCGKEAETSFFPYCLAALYRSRSETLSNRLAASRNYKAPPAFVAPRSFSAAAALVSSASSKRTCFNNNNNNISNIIIIIIIIDINNININISTNYYYYYY